MFLDNLGRSDDVSHHFGETSNFRTFDNPVHRFGWRESSRQRDGAAEASDFGFQERQMRKGVVLDLEIA